MSRSNYENRAAMNDRSRNTAKHHAEPWTAEEVDFLREFWDGTDSTLAEIAEALGRTIEACRQKYYYPGGQPRDKSSQHQNGWLYGVCIYCGNFADVFCTGLIQECEDCR
jgi:hypothetical protein